MIHRPFGEIFDDPTCRKKVFLKDRVFACGKRRKLLSRNDLFVPRGAWDTPGTAWDMGQAFFALTAAHGKRKIELSQ